jgi:ATP phosphoribosyltransferase
LFSNIQADSRQLIVASEYRRLATDYIKSKNLNAIFLHAYGATEALPPEDADIVIDNTSTGATLHHNRLAIIDNLMRSTTRFICNRDALKDPFKRKKLEEMTMLMQSTIRAQDRVMLEMNVPLAYFDRVVNDLPCMRSPTVSKLHNNDGFVVKIAVSKSIVPQLIPKLVELGATDILEFKVEKIVI